MAFLTSDILFMSTLIPRLQKEADKTYEELISEDIDIKEMKQEILLSVEKALEEASQFCRDFERYSYLWLEDREYCMELFLEFGRILGEKNSENPEDISMINHETSRSRRDRGCRQQRSASAQALSADHRGFQGDDRWLRVAAC